MKRWIWLAAGALLASGIVAAGAAGAETKEPAEMTPDDILACVEASGPQKTSIQTGRMRVEDAKGAAREAKAKAWWARFDDLSHILVEFSAPEDLRGSKLLVLEKPKERSEMFMYLPELQRTKRVSSHMMSASVFGTDFSYEDVERLYGLATNLSSRRLEDTTHDGRLAFVVESVPSPDADSSYSRIVETIEQERCVALQLAFYEEGDEPRKIVTVDPEQIRQVGGSWIPEQFSIRDLRDSGTTTIFVDKIEVDEELSKRMFSQGRLSRGN